MFTASKFITSLPKAELHLHIEGSLEPELMFKLAQRNQIALKYRSVDEIRRAYQFTNLQSFLDIYYAGAAVLVTEQDFYDLAMAYFQRCHADGVVHAELFFDPQTHTHRGIEFATCFRGLWRAAQDAQAKLGVSSQLIMCILRHLSEDDAFATLEQSLPFKSGIVAIGLDSSEVGHPPEKFKDVFDAAREAGYLTVAHAGEEGPPEYIWQALDILKVSRIDHGVRCMEDPELVAKLRDLNMPLTVCPLSNVKLRVFDKLSDHNLGKMLAAGLNVCINSDDPAYFGGYVAQNYQETQEALKLSNLDMQNIARNSLRSSFAEDELKGQWIAKLDDIRT